MVLEQERELYAQMKAELLKHHKGQYALIKGQEFIGAFTTAEEAFNEGVRRFGNQPFLIQHVTEREEVEQYPALAVGLISARS